MCTEWNSFPRAAAKWFIFFNQEVYFTSILIFVAWRVKIRMTFPTMIIMANSIFPSYKMAVKKLRSQILKRKKCEAKKADV